MKLRIKGNSIRLRLNRGEVDRMARGEAIWETTALPGGTSFLYGLQSTAEATRMGVDFNAGQLTVTLPRSATHQWVGSDMVSLADEIELSGGERLRLLVEKDFACLKPREGDDDEDAFPHPEAGPGVTC